MATAPDYTGVEDSIKQGYNAQRQKAATTEAANLQGQRDALARREAQLSGGPGGAFVKAEQQAGNDSAQRLQQANSSIDDAQNQELRGVKMTQLGQQYSTGEREASQGYQSGEAAKGRQFQTSERTGSQDFAASEQDKQITAQKIMQQTGITAQSTLQEKQLAAQAVMQQTGLDAQKAMQLVGITSQEDMQKAALELNKEEHNDTMTLQKEQMREDLEKFNESMGMSRDQFAEQTGVDQFNEQMAEKMFNKKDMLEQALGPLTPSGGQGPTGGLPGFFGKFI